MTRLSTGQRNEPAPAPASERLHAIPNPKRTGWRFAADLQAAVLGSIRALDIVIVVVTGLVAFWIRHGAIPVPAPYLIAIGAGGFVAVIYLQFAKLYSIASLRRVNSQAGGLTVAWIAVLLTLVVFAYLTKYSENLSRLWLIIWLLLGIAAFLVSRIALAARIAAWSRQGMLTRNIAVIGAGEYGRRLIDHLDRRHDDGVRLIGVFDPRTTRVPADINGHPVLGTVDDLFAVVRHNRVDEIIIALPWRAGPHLMELLGRLKSLAADIKLCPDLIGFQIPSLGYSDLGGVPMLGIYERPIHGWSYLIKGIEDRVLGALIALAALPVCLLIAAAVRLDSPGPVLFRQTRYGFNSNKFQVLKFRTMAMEAATDPAAPQATPGDARVTRVGHFLRRTSLDELPQLINVLRGEMSLVGPRPHAVPHNEQYAALIGDYLSRHRVKPGMTGWAQVNGLRGETNAPDAMRQRVQHDLYYIEHWSLLFDLKILFLTLLVGFVHRNAY